MNKIGKLCVSGSMLFGLLFLIFNFGFIITPFWLLPEQPIVKFLLLLGTIIPGLIWAYLSAGTVELQFNLKSLPPLICLFVAVIAMNFQPLLSDIPWRGDEDFHISYVLALINNLPPYWLVFIVVGFLIFLYLISKNQQVAIIFYSAIMLIVYCALVVFRTRPLQDLPFFPRYPYLTYWVTAFLIKIPSLFWGTFHESFFRLIPVVFTGVIIWIFLRASFGKVTIPGFLAGIVIASIPVVYYYSSIFYLELPAVCLMFIVCLRIDQLLCSDFEEIRNDPGWYALIFIGLIKETAIPFLLVFVVFHVAIKIIKVVRRNRNWRIEDHQPVVDPRKGLFQVISQEVVIGFLLLFPAALYVFFRTSMIDTFRGNVPSVNNLLHLSTYEVIIRSFLEQFGPFLILFLAGCILLIRQGEKIRAGFYLSCIVVFLIFFTVDDWRYIGYSRFNLLILPEILACGIVVIQRLKDRKIIGPAITIVILALNFMISPINSDGTKKPLWGNYNFDTSEHYYPYEETLQWIKDSDIDGPLLFTGLDYAYFFDFYFYKLNWLPVYRVILSEGYRDEKKDILEKLAIAKEENYSFVIYQIAGRDIAAIENGNGYAHKQAFCNMAHCLLVFY